MFTSLAEVVARKAPLEWFEAVAIVQALARTVVDGPTGGRGGMPDPASVMLTSEGDVVVASTPRGGNAVNDLARLLSALVAPEAMPASLRRVAAQALAVPPLYASPRELMEALAYFERPNLQETLAAAYLRWLRLPPEEPQRPTIQPRASPPAPPRPGPAPWRSRAGVAAAVVTAVVLLGVPSWWTWSRPRHGWFGTTGARISRLFAAGGSAQGTGSAPEAAGAVDSAAADLDAPSPESGPGRPVARARRRPLTTPSAASGGAADPGAASGSRPALGAGSDEGREAEDMTVYSADSSDVVPPAPVYAMQPSTPPPGVRAEDLPVVDLVVSRSGEVESVRLVRSSGDVRAPAALSAVKAWRFRPATKNGRPVRYRLTLQLTRR